MKLRLLPFIFCSIALFEASAQQDPYYSHFMLNKTSYNPAAAGVNDAICANLLGHRQWLGLNNENELGFNKGANLDQSEIGPTTINFGVSAWLRKLNAAVGLTLIQDKIGYESNLSIRVPLAFRFNMSNGQKLQVGIDPGLIQKNYNGKYFRALQPNDPHIPTEMVSDRKFDIGAGVYYMNPAFNNLYVGVSATHLTQPTLSYSWGNPASTVSTQTVRHIYIVAGTEHIIGSGNLALQPNIWIKKDPSILQVDLNARLVYMQKLVAGVSYRNGGNNKFLETLSPQFGYYVMPNLYIGYSYDVPLLKRIGAGGTHEIVATYCFKLPYNPPVDYYRSTPRFLGGYN